MAALLLLAPGYADGFTVAFEDVNPDSSTLDGGIGCSQQGAGSIGGCPDADSASGGRTNALAAVPGSSQVFYAATEWGGLYKTTDGGLTWSHLDGHVPTATRDVEVDPSNPNRVYATSWFDGRATGSRSGIEVSNDGGVTWTHPATATPPADFDCSADRRTQPSAFGIGIRPDAPQNVFVGTNCGVAISTDSGATWSFVDPTPGDPADDVWDVLVQADGADGIVDVCGDDGHLRSTDGGSTWVASAGLPAGRCSLAASPDESYVLFAAAADNFIYESDDADAVGGGSWTNRGTPDTKTQGRIPFVVVNDRADSAFDLWFGDVRLYRGACTTPDDPSPGGAFRCPAGSNPPSNVLPANWAGPFTRSAGAHDDVGDLAFDSTVSPDACPLVFSSDGGVYYNTDTGADCQNPDWEQPTVTPHALWVYGMSGVDVAGATAEDLYLSLQDNGTFASSDAGAPLPTWAGRDCCDSFDMVADAFRVVSTACCSWSLRFSDPGLTNTQDVATAPPGGRRTFEFPDWIARYGNNQYIAVNAAGAFVTNSITASPVAWTQIGAATTPAAGFCSVQVATSGGTPSFFANTRCITRSGGIFEDGPGGGQLWRFDGTNPAGAWQRLDDNGLAGGIEAFGVAPSDPNRIYGLNQAPTGPQVVFSNDGGQTWNPDPELDALMTGGGTFLYQPTRGPTPHALDRGYTQASLFAFDPSDPDVIVAGGRDSGVFLSVDGGADWALLSDPTTPDVSGVPQLPRPWFAYFDDEPGDPAGQHRFFVGTQGRGVWRVAVDNLPPICDADGPYEAECSGESTEVMLDGTGSSDPDGDAISWTWTGPFEGGTAAGATPTVAFPGTGDFVVDLEVRDPLEASVCSADVSIVDTTPPEVHCSTLATSLWPPNHKLVRVGLDATATDICFGDIPVLVDVFADEDDEEQTGDGRHSPDASLGADLRLRSERKGDADGRVYLIRAAATDPAGNIAYDCCTVTVPHSLDPSATASVAAQATTAEAVCDADGTIPAGFFPVGDGPILGPKQ